MLYDKTGQAVKFKDYSQAESAVKEGQVFFAKDDEVTLVNRDYKPITVKGDIAKDMIDRGWSLNPIAIVAAKDAKAQGVLGTLKQAGSSFINEAAFGIPDMVKEAGTTDALEAAKAEALRKQNPIAHAVGSVGGFGTSLLYGGQITGATKLGAMAGRGAEKVATSLLGSATERNLAKRILAGAIEQGVKTGVETAAWSAPRALAEAALGDPEEAAETIAGAGVIGAVLGVAISPLAPSINKFVTKTGEKMKGAKLIDKSKAGAEILGLSPKQYDMVSQTVREDLPAVVDDLSFRALFKKSDALEAIQLGREQAGKTIGGVFKEVDSKLAKMKGFKKSNTLFIGDLLDDIETKYLAPYKMPDGAVRAGFQKNVREVERKINELRKINIDSLGKLQEERVLLRKSTPKYKYDGSEAENLAHEALDDLYRGVSERIKTKIVPEVAGAIKNPGLADDLIKASRDYHVFSSLEPLVQKEAWKQAGRKVIGFKDLLSIVAGGELGKIPGGIAGLVVSKGQQFAPQIKYLTADIVNKVGQKMTELSPAVSKMLSGKVGTGIVPAGINVLVRENNKDKQLSAVSDKLLADKDPTTILNVISERLAPLQDELNEGQRASVSNKLMTIMDYLKIHSPKAPETNPLEDSNWRPSDTQMAQFNRRVEVAINPFKIIDYIKNGSITQDQINTVSDLYPRLMDKIRIEVARQISDNKTKGIKMPYQAKINASKLLGIPLERGMANIQSLQNNFKRPELEQAQRPRTAKFETPNIQSEQQRLQNRKMD